MKIKITKNGPYEVSGSIPLYEKIIVSKNGINEYEEGRELPQLKTYKLCRCGHSKNPPFCDGSHLTCGFKCKETASKEDYIKRVDLIEGPGINLLDDGRGAFARFCHREDGSAWELVLKSDNENCKEQLIKAASECPSGRLTALSKEGELIEDDYEPSIIIAQDPIKGCSAGILVRGYIPIESEDGSMYEERNRVALCRCGESSNKPFCDATHVSIRYRDK